MGGYRCRALGAWPGCSGSSGPVGDPLQPLATDRLGFVEVEVHASSIREHVVQVFVDGRHEVLHDWGHHPLGLGGGSRESKETRIRTTSRVHTTDRQQCVVDLAHVVHVSVCVFTRFC